MIYVGKRLVRYRNHELEKGDIGFIEFENLPEAVVDTAFFLKDVSTWERYEDLALPYRSIDKSKLMYVSIKDEETMVLVESFDSFTEMMIKEEMKKPIRFTEQ